GVRGDGMHGMEFARLRPSFSPGFYPVAFLVVFHDARIVVAVGEKAVAGSVPGDVCWTVKKSMREFREVRIRRRGRSARRRGRSLDSLGLATIEHDDPPLRVEDDSHVGAFIHAPDVVVLVDSNDVGKGKSVQVFADFADKLSVGFELKEPRLPASREDENVSLRIDGHAGDFPKIKIGRKLENIWDGIVGNFGNGLLLTERQQG